MAFTKISFDGPFVPGSHPLERKKAGPRDAVVLLEFAPGFADPEWCRRSHVVYVVRGELTLELEGSREHLREGDACVLDAGTAHKASNDGAEPVLLFVVSDLERAAAAASARVT